MTMKKPELEVVRFASEDVIATSGVGGKHTLYLNGEDITSYGFTLGNAGDITLVCSDTCNGYYHAHADKDKKRFVIWDDENKYWNAVDDPIGYGDDPIGFADKWYYHDGETWQACSSQ